MTHIAAIRVKMRVEPPGSAELLSAKTASEDLRCFHVEGLRKLSDSTRFILIDEPHAIYGPGRNARQGIAIDRESLFGHVAGFVLLHSHLD